MFEIYTMVSKAHENIDLILVVKNFVELEVELSMRELKFKCLKRSVPIFPVHEEIIKLKERRYLQVEALLSG